MAADICGSLSSLCWLFCCPPLPHLIAAKLAFFPPDPSYRFERKRKGYKLFLKSPYSRGVDLAAIEVFLTKTARGHNIACMHVKCCSRPKKTILYSHGNAVDLGQMTRYYFELGTTLKCNVFSYDYSGYGQSEGQPSEKNLYADIQAAWSAMQKRYGIHPKDIVLYGRSIGSAPTIDLASKHDVAGIVLHSPLVSGVRVLFPNSRRNWFFDSFVSTGKIPKVKSPVLVIHGTNDDVIDIANGVAIFELCPSAVEPLWVEGAGHNDIETRDEFAKRLKRFIDKELRR